MSFRGTDGERMARAAEGVCPICSRSDGKYLVLDHDHKTGAYRCHICTQCNTGLGMFGDSPAVMLKAVEYLIYHAERALAEAELALDPADKMAVFSSRYARRKATKSALRAAVS